MTVAALEEKLKAAIEDNIKLEQYRENLRFNNITVEESEDCKSLIYEAIQNKMGIDIANIKFHAVHRIDRNQIWQNKSKIKHSDKFPDAHITEDFAKADTG